jgi:hypothetical protein
MLRRFYNLFLLTLILSACQPDGQSSAPTVIAFPTVTPGRVLTGILPTSDAMALNGSGLANPATAVALASRPTATPDYSACPAVGTMATVMPPGTGRNVDASVNDYLSAGNDPALLQNALPTWGATGIVHPEYDLTGEGVAEVVVSYATPARGGELIILNCLNGRYSLRYQTTTGSTEAPAIVNIGDMNYDSRNDVMFAANVCDSEGVCDYNTQLLTWNGALGRYVSLLEGAISSDAIPTIADVDNDRVNEIVVQLEDDGNEATGPLRTGTHIYDWNGGFYVLSIVQLDPPRYTIQVVHEADRAFLRLDIDSAITLYSLARDSTTLRNWFNDEQPILQSYILYRLLLSYAYTEAGERLIVLQDINTLFPDSATAPVYVTLALTFWNALQVSANLRTACIEVINLVAQRPDALSLLNRYGSRSPTYTAQDLCPF